MRITGKQTFTSDQLVWLERIRIHLEQNLSIDKIDFDDQPTFSGYGGWSKANRIFNDKLGAMLTKITKLLLHKD